MRYVVLVIGLLSVTTHSIAQSEQKETPQTSSPAAYAQEDRTADDDTPTSGRLLSRQGVAQLSGPAALAEVARLTEKEAQDRRDALDDFKKGAGLGISVVIGDNEDVIDDATIVDGKIVVTRRAKDQTRAALEVHQLFTGSPFTAKGRENIRKQVERCASDSINCPLVGIGPFAAIQTGDNNSINSVGLGMMIGVRSDPRQDSSFNIGLGIVFDSKIKELAAGFAEGQAPPTGQTQVRFSERSGRRLMITMSFAF